MSIQITGAGIYLPDKIEESKSTAQLINKSEDWIISKTGVKERRISKIDVDQMGAIAAAEALMHDLIPSLELFRDSIKTKTEEWNGVSWAETSDLNTARTEGGRAGAF